MEIVKIIVLAIVGMVVLNWILDKLYSRFPMLQRIVLLVLTAISAIYLVFSIKSQTIDDDLFIYAIIQFIYFYNLFTEVEAVEWDEVVRTRDVSRGFLSEFTVTEKTRVDSHWHPGWMVKLIRCVIFTLISAVAVIFLDWFTFIIIGIEVITAFRI
jgi:hypothetical protein